MMGTSSVVSAAGLDPRRVDNGIAGVLCRGDATQEQDLRRHNPRGRNILLRITSSLLVGVPQWVRLPRRSSYCSQPVSSLPYSSFPTRPRPFKFLLTSGLVFSYIGPMKLLFLVVISAYVFLGFTFTPVKAFADSSVSPFRNDFSHDHHRGEEEEIDESEKKA